MQLLVPEVHEIPKTILKCLNRKIIKRVNIGKLHIKPHLEDRERLMVEQKVGEFKSQAMMSLHICYKNDGIQPKLKTTSDIFKRPI